MPRTKRIYSNSGYMHVMSRGVGKQIIYEDDQDRKYFVKIMKKYATEDNIKIHAYCLMNNHFHILLYDKDQNVSNYMQHLNMHYSIYYNGKYDHVGHLFQDRYHSENIEDEAYYMTVFRYIIRNAENANICSTAEYKWHSLYNVSTINSFVDIKLAIQLAGGINKLKEYILTPNKDTCMEFDITPTYSDESIKEMISNKYNLKSGTEIRQMDKEKRDKIIIELTDIGITQRQLERLTGISRKTLRKITSK